MRIPHLKALSFEIFLNIELVPNLSFVELNVFCWKGSKGEINNIYTEDKTSSRNWQILQAGFSPFLVLTQ